MSARETKRVLRRANPPRGRPAYCEVSSCHRSAEFLAAVLTETGKPIEAVYFCALHARVAYPEAAGQIDDGADEAEIES